MCPATETTGIVSEFRSAMLLELDFENEARKVIEFIGLPWDEACLKFHEAGRTVHTFSKQQVRSPIYKSSIERWRNYEKELQPLLSALGDLV